MAPIIRKCPGVRELFEILSTQQRVKRPDSLGLTPDVEKLEMNLMELFEFFDGGQPPRAVSRKRPKVAPQEAPQP